jgi:small subunit ribosomal protein S3
MSARKMRLVIDQIRGHDVNDAYAILRFSKKAAARPIDKALRSAVANAVYKADEAGEALDVDDLFVREGIRPRDDHSSTDEPRDRGRRHQEGVSVGQKTHPYGFRLGGIKPWKSRWYAQGKVFPQLLEEDEKLRRYLGARLGHAAVSAVDIERKPSKIVVTIHTGRPGVVIGKRGAEVDKLRDELSLLTDAEVSINVEEVKRPEMDAQLVAESVAHQLTQRISFRRAMKRAVQAAMRSGAEGIRIQCGGRLAGAEIARTEGYHEGRVPLHTMRADIDYAQKTATTTFGTIGVKVWVFNGEVVEDRRGQTYTAGGRK